ncbi:MAG: hypothetical protein AAFX02_08500, partial [Pseudomonadota bacterium]
GSLKSRRLSGALKPLMHVHVNSMDRKSVQIEHFLYCTKSVLNVLYLNVTANAPIATQPNLLPEL